jgi:hypothetical protein
MDVFPALNSRLSFIRSFYFTAAPPFEALLRRHNPRYDPGEDDPPQDESERWQEARKGLEVLGHCSLSLVAKAIEDYLRQLILREVGEMPVLRGKSKFEKYESFLLNKTTFRWRDASSTQTSPEACCPIGRDRIEQINLCRNDFIHDPFIDRGQPKQSKRHFEKYPSSRFVDPIETAVEMASAEAAGKEFQASPASLTVDRHGLVSAMKDARGFCQFVEALNTKKP